MMKLGTASTWICQPSRTNRMFHILVGEVRYVRSAIVSYPGVLIGCSDIVEHK